MKQQDFIRIEGAKENNLKNLNLQIPKNKLVVFTGLSGSGLPLKLFMLKDRDVI